MKIGSFLCHSEGGMTEESLTLMQQILNSLKRLRMTHFSILLFLISILLVPTLAQAKKAPDWVNGISKKYPSPRYFIGVGAYPLDKGSRGQVRKWAGDEARAEISKILRTEIKATTRSMRIVSSERTGKKSEPVSKSQKTDLIIAKTNEVLEGVEIKGYYKDKKSKMIYALAVLDRYEAEKRIEKIITNFQKDLLSEMEMGEELKNQEKYLQSIKHYERAYVYAAQITPQRELLSVVSPTGGTKMGGDVYYEAELKLILYKLKRKISFTVDITGPASSVRTYIIKGLSKSGYNVGKSKGMTQEYNLIGITGVSRRGDMKMGPNLTVQIYQADLDLEIQDAVTSDALGAFTWAANANEKSDALARKSAIRALGEIVEKEISIRMVEEVK